MPCLELQGKIQNFDGDEELVRRGAPLAGLAYPPVLSFWGHFVLCRDHKGELVFLWQFLICILGIVVVLVFASTYICKPSKTSDHIE